MRTVSYFGLAILVVAISGCTEMRVEGDAKIFQSSAIGSLIRTIVGIGLIGLGGVAIAGGVLPDKKPKKRAARANEKLSSGQRLGLMAFGGAMAFAGLFLAGASLIFPNKLHVTVYPDRVRMASTYSQTGGREVEVPFAGLASVELRDERILMGKFKTFLVFTQTNGNIIRQDAGNNERKALETIQQALAAFAGQSSEGDISASKGENPVVADPMSGSGSGLLERPLEQPRTTEPGGSEPGAPTAPPAFTISGIVRPPASGSTDSPAAAASKQYSLKRYEITIPVPAGYTVVGPDMIVEVGRKLKACYAGSWSTVTVVAVNGDGTLSCNWDSYPAFTYKMMREDLTIETGHAGQPMDSSPNTAVSGSNPPPNAPPAKEYMLKRYPITIPVPRGYAVVDAKSDVKVGMKLGACYARGWEPVTVVAINDDGTITCNWDSYPAFTYKMMREDLTMKKR